MSIKKLFKSTEKQRNYLSTTDEKDAFANVESAQNVTEITEKQKTFIPQVNYNDPKSFVKFGSADLYYKSAIERIVDFFPYDGSDSERTKFFNESLDIEKHILDSLYPRTHGYINVSSDGWGTLSGSLQYGYGLPSTLEYIDFQGGPHTITSSTTAGLFRDAESSKRDFANIYEENLYTNAGLPSDYGSGSRESNLKADFDNGVTIEFWVKTGSLDQDLTRKQVLVDIWNNELSSSAYGAAEGANPNPAYGRITITFQGAATSGTSPFRITAQSGANGIFEQTIGTDIGVDTFNEWRHYAFSMYNSSSQFVTKLYVDGKINDTNVVGNSLSEINSKNAVGRLGALLTAPSGSGGPQRVENMKGAGKLSGSIDEFRFWKATRNGEQIYQYWFDQVRGGSNTDLANTTLGLYYKFNEGITGDSTIDSSVLDYSGRITNGSWVGYVASGRSTNSAIIEASASTKEYKDPIIYATHPDVVSLKNTLQRKGSAFDFQNNASFKNLIPSWVVEEVDSRDGEFVRDNTNNLQAMSHIIGAYFDKLRLLIQSTPKVRQLNYTSASYTPLPFAKHLPQSLGLYMPDIFIEADVMETFLNRNDSMLFEGDLTETKNLIYQNIYNNLTNIYKTKGTEASIRNVLRCFHTDDKLLRLNVYSRNQVYELKNNLRQTLVNKKHLNLNVQENAQGVVYQAQDNTLATATIVIADSGGIINGETFTLVDSAGRSTVYTINGGVAPASGGGSGGSATVGFSGVGGGSAGKVAAAAAMVIAINATTDANYKAVSDGVDTVTITQGTGGSAGNTTNADSISSTTVSNFTGGTGNGESLGYISGSEGMGSPAGTGYESKYGFTMEADVLFPNFENSRVPVNREYTDVSLFGMCSASTDDTGPRPLNDTTWYSDDNASFQVYALRDKPGSKNVRFKLTSSGGPDVDQPFPILTSSTFYDVYDNQRWNFSVRLKPSNYPLSDVVTGSDTYTYDLIFKGTNAELGVVRNTFELTASVGKTVGQNFLKAAKRVYVGARKTNVTGALLTPSDVLVDGTRYWLKYLDDLSLNQHAFDIDNYGISGSYQHPSPLDINLLNKGSVWNSNMLALNWEFNNVSSSDANGSFIVTDISSGSAELRDNYGWVGATAGYQLVGSGSGWPASTQTVIQSQSINAYQFINPELAISSDMVQILSDDDKYFGTSETPPDYYYTFEKSMYNAISEEMLNFFAGVVDFNNVIGEPVNRYRTRYKTLEKLREIFFRRVTTVKEVEKFIDYYKWFDDALAEVISQLIQLRAISQPILIMSLKVTF